MDNYTLAAFQTIDRISRTCPRAISTFIHLVFRADDDGKIVLTKQQIIDDLSESYTKFKNDVRSLSRENILEWHQMGEYLHVTLTTPGDFRDVV